MLFLFLLAQLPFRLQMWLGQLLGRTLYYLLGTRRYVAERNIELCFPELAQAEKKRFVKKHFESNGVTLFETGMAWFMPYWRLRKRFVIKGEAHWRAIQAEGKGALIMAVHFNTLEITNVAINRLFNMSMSYRPHNNPVYDLVQRYGRERHNPRSEAVQRDDVRGMVRAMKKGGWLWYAADQDYGPRVSEFIPWFGVDAAMVSAPPRLAAMADVPIVGISYRRLPDYSGYEVTFMPAFKGLPSGDSRADLVTLNRHYEQCIRENPEEYLWVHRRFKTRPPGQEKLYCK
jgi:KDO2-lipid IV(A) lauroyltransferase